MSRHLRNLIIGFFWGITIWVVSSIMLVAIGSISYGKEINYENTVSHRITAKRIPTIDEIEEEIDRVFGSETWGRRVAWCESRYNFGAINDTSGASGLFQFMPTTFSANGGDDIWNWKEQITIAKKMFDNGQAYQWSCK